MKAFTELEMDEVEIYARWMAGNRKGARLLTSQYKHGIDDDAKVDVC